MKLFVHSLGRLVSKCGVVTALIFIFSCSVIQPIQHTFSKKDSIIERERVVEIKVPGTTINTHLSKAQLDSLTTALQSMPIVHRHIYMTDPKLQTRLSFALDSIGRLVIGCETMEKMYFEKLKEKDHIIQEKEFEIREEHKKFGQKLSDFIKTGFWSILIFIGLAVFAYIKLK